MVINLEYLEKSQVSYKKTKYPDGQVSIELLDTPDGKSCYLIHARINSYDDLFYILGVTDILRYHGVTDISLYVPCFIAQRSDRRFRDDLQSFDLGVIANIINAQHYSSVTVMHAHSDVLPALINNCHVLNNYSLVQHAYRHIGECILVSPDAGAYKKVGELGQKMKLDVVAANKFRMDGEINLLVTGNVKDKTCLIVDDYCDGGRTFVILATKLRELGATHVYLAVTHGLFSNGLGGLSIVIDQIFTTNSIKDINDTFINQLKVI